MGTGNDLLQFLAVGCIPFNTLLQVSQPRVFAQNIDIHTSRCQHVEGRAVGGGPDYIQALELFLGPTGADTVHDLETLEALNVANGQDLLDSGVVETSKNPLAYPVNRVCGQEKVVALPGQCGDHAITLAFGNEFLRPRPGIEFDPQWYLQTTEDFGHDVVVDADGLAVIVPGDERVVVFIIDPVECLFLRGVNRPCLGRCQQQKCRQ